jgi:hypothetical protein
MSVFKCTITDGRPQSLLQLLPYRFDLPEGYPAGKIRLLLYF